MSFPPRRRHGPIRSSSAATSGSRIRQARSASSCGGKRLCIFVTLRASRCLARYADRCHDGAACQIVSQVGHAGRTVSMAPVSSVMNLLEYRWTPETRQRRRDGLPPDRRRTGQCAIDQACPAGASTLRTVEPQGAPPTPCPGRSRTAGDLRAGIRRIPHDPSGKRVARQTAGHGRPGRHRCSGRFRYRAYCPDRPDADRGTAPRAWYRRVCRNRRSR